MEKLLDKFRFFVVDLETRRELSKHTKIKYARQSQKKLYQRDGFTPGTLIIKYAPRTIQLTYPKIKHTWDSFFKTYS